ncbi:hypothetical protein LIER_09555 [Lithospermum erythrorhizon]|uniref:Uncharacterized protein n=1 Tax=Lithospermum erythrorhizon TaxID=34254 RepID=A0AAV3PG85_LITER
MAQLERLPRSHEFSRSPQCQNSPKFEQFLEGDGSSGLLMTSTSPRSCDQEDQHKKSVLMKVKEKAMKLRHSLSGKKKHGMETHDDNTTPSRSLDNTTPSRSLALEDSVDVGEDPEYLGAPMYESELAPETLKENSRQHPRAVPVVPGNHTLASCLKTKVTQEKNENISPDKTTAQSVSVQSAPAYAKVSDATHSIASKITGLSITNQNEQDTNTHTGGTHVPASAAVGTGYVSGPLNDKGLNNSERMSEIREHSSDSPQKFDKGVSVKEYLMQKVEPGEDEKALSKVISNSLSPKRSPGQMGVVGKFKDAVSSLLWTEEDSESTGMNTTNKSSPTTSARKLQSREANDTTNPISSSETSVSNRTNPLLAPGHTNTSEVVEEQTLGRVLQTN